MTPVLKLGRRKRKGDEDKKTRGKKGREQEGEKKGGERGEVLLGGMGREKDERRKRR